MKAAAGAVLLQLLFGYVLVTGLVVHVKAVADSGLKLFGVAPEPPPPPPVRIVPIKAKTYRPEGAAAPANLRSKATEVAAPKPVVPIVLPPPPIIAAPIPSTGTQASSGASDRPGPGTGSGGIGNGMGSGGSGDGDGNGLGDFTPPKLISDRIRGSDYPDWAGDDGVRGVIGVRYLVQTDGRVSGCVIARSSGDPRLDEHTCQVIERRYRYRPSLDERRRPVRAYVYHDFSWLVRE